MRPHPLPFVCLFPALALPALAQSANVAAPLLRHDIVQFHAPAGWSCRTVGSDMVLTPPEPGFRLVVEHSQTLAGALGDLLEQRVAAYAGEPGYERQGERLQTRIPATGVDYAAELFLLGPPTAGAPTPGVWLILLAGGGRVAALRCEFDDPQVYGKFGDAVTALVNAAKLTTRERLERGRPPLTRYMVDEAVAFLEWLLQSPFPEAQAAAVESELRASWRAGDRAEIDGLNDLLQARQNLAAMRPEERELARVQVLEQALTAWREERESSRGAALMLAIHADVDRVLAEGQPPLTRHAVEAFAEFLHFAGQQVAGVRAPLPAAVREQVVADVVAEWPRLPAEQRQLVVGMPLGWAALRLRWPELNADERQAMVADWRAMPRIVALGQAIATAASADAQQQQAAAAKQSTSISEALRLQRETERIRASMRIVNISFPQPYRW
jgi:hypothetical protein